MFFGLSHVSSHPLYQLHPAMQCFFEHCKTATDFDIECFPEWFRPVIRRSHRLKARLVAIVQLLQGQSQDVRTLLFDAFLNNSQVETLCEDTSSGLITLEGMPEALRTEIRGLFDHLYDNTINTEIFNRAVNGSSINDHYQRFRRINKSVCPFCGIENYPDPTSGTRVSYDHYLNRADYPLAGINFDNLIPMCKNCNEPPNKGSHDILFTTAERTTRRQVFYPYREQQGITLEVSCPVKPTLTNRKGKWNITISPKDDRDRDKVQTWDSVFRIKKRLEARIKDKNEVWTRHFIASHFNSSPCSIATLRDALDKEAKTLSDSYFIQAKSESVVQTAFYEYLSKHAEEVVLESYCMMAGTPYIGATAQRGSSLIQ